MKRFLSYIVILFLALSGLQAQAPRLYSTAEGLASTRISQIMFDKDNFLWVTTDRGLCRFEGKTFTTYQRQSGNPYALQENQVSSTSGSRVRCLLPHLAHSVGSSKATFW